MGVRSTKIVKPGMLIKLAVFLSMALYSTLALSGNPFQQLGNKISSFGSNLSKSISKPAIKNEEDFKSNVLGVWKGTVKQNGLSPYNVELYLYDFKEGAKVGTSYYPTLGCSGSLRLQAWGDDVSVFNEAFNSGARKECQDAIINAKLTGRDKASLIWGNTRGTRLATAKVKRWPYSNDPSATVSKGANIRSGPSTKKKVIGNLKSGTPVNIIAVERDWYMLQAGANGAQGGGWIHSSLISFNKKSVTPRFALGLREPSKSRTSQPAANSNKVTTQSNIDYAGYSKGFIPVKQLYREGDLDGVANFYEGKLNEKNNQGESGQEALKIIGLLQWWEQGTLAIDRGDYDKAIDDFSTAEDLIEKRNNDSKVVAGFKKTGGWILGTVLGNEEISAYSGNGWERVLMLNYKSIAYLLKGQRRAYNVTRRAIDWQNLEKKAFDHKLLEEKDKTETKLDEEKDKVKKKVADVDKGKKVNNTVRKGLVAAFAPMEAKASSVSSAYVNPFGYYVAGMVQEFESYNDRSLRDNARISYEKALELNPKSKVLKRAVKDLKNTTAPPGRRLIHVVVADGFVPEKKVLDYNVKVGNSVVPLKMPIYQPIQSKVHRIEVATTSGKRIARLSSVADVEAICLRQQMDIQPLLIMRAMTSFMTNAFLDATAQGAEGIKGVILHTVSAVRKITSAPDTRSWMSLPATIQAARFHLAKGTNKLVIRTYSKSGKKLSSKTVRIDPYGHNFIYARSIDNALFAQSNEKLWLAGM